MKRLLVIIMAIVFSLSIVSFAGAGKKDKSRNGNRQQNQQYRQKGQRGPNNYYKGPSGERGHHRWSNRYRRHGRPHHYQYRGHWRSRNQWENHRRRNHDRYRDGRYYRDNNGFMMFSFCEGNGLCFSFSIND